MRTLWSMRYKLFVYVCIYALYMRSCSGVCVFFFFSICTKLINSTRTHLGHTCSPTCTQLANSNHMQAVLSVRCSCMCVCAYASASVYTVAGDSRCFIWQCSTEHKYSRLIHSDGIVYNIYTCVDTICKAPCEAMTLHINWICRYSNLLLMIMIQCADGIIYHIRKRLLNNIYQNSVTYWLHTN